MSTEVVKQIIERAIVDLDFRQLLFADPEMAMTDYDLTTEEVDLLKALSLDHLESFAGDLEDRISRARVKVQLPWDTPLPPPPK